MQDYVDHLTKAVGFSNQAIQRSREAMETKDPGKVAIQLTEVGDLLFKAHSEALAAVMSLRSQ